MQTNRIEEEHQDLLRGQHDDSQNIHELPGTAPKSNKKKIIIGVVSGIVVIGIILAIVLPLTLKSDDHDNPPNPFDYQEYNPYKVEAGKNTTTDWFATGQVSIPTKIDKLFTSLQDSHRQPGQYYKPVNPEQIPNAPNNPFATNLNYSFTLVDNYQARIRIFDRDTKNPYQVSDDVFPRPVESFEARLTQVGYDVKVDPFSFRLGNIYNGETLISTEKRKLVVAEKFSEIGLRLPTRRIFGLGQHNSQFLLKNGTYSLWAKDYNGTLPFDNGNGGVSGNHIHPFVLCQTQNKDFFGIFFVGTTAQAFEVVYFDNYQEVVLNYITLGGQIEMYVIMRGSANDIISKYHAMIGYSQMPPYYALGVFQGSNYYDSSAALQEVIDGYNKSTVNVEGFLVEKYYDSGKVFSNNKIPDLKDFGTKLSKNNQKLFVSISSGIIDDSKYSYRTDYKDYFIKSFMTKNELVGKQNDVHTVYPDFFNPDVSKLYVAGLTELGTNVGNIDGIVFNNLQFSNEINGEYVPEKPKRSLYAANEEQVGQHETYKINTDQKEMSYYFIPFVPGYENSGFLDTMTISSNATHIGYDEKVQNKSTIEFYLHNANGHMGLKRLNNVIVKEPTITRRPLLFSDTTWAGSGAFGAALITDVFRNWDNLKSTISMAMGLSMYGFSNIVTDVCGTIGPLDEELCGRWMQLAAFLPMARNYYTGSYKDEKTEAEVKTEPSEFYKLKNFDYQVMTSSAIHQKSAFSRYTYSQMYKVYRDGGSIIRPLFFEYPEDDNCFNNDVIDSTFMLGDAIKVSPVLGPNVQKYNSYFPKGEWADLNDYAKKISSNGQNVELEQHNTYTNVHLKAGKIVPFQFANGLHTTKTFEQRPMTFLINRDSSHYAEGYILVDDGLSKNSYDDEQYTFWKLRYAEKSINFWVQYGNFDYQPKDMQVDQLEEIKILHANDLNDTNFACYLGTNLNPQQLQISFNKEMGVLSLKPMIDQTVNFKDIGVIKFGNSKKETNFCDLNAFSYKADVVSQADHNMVLKLTNKQDATINGNLYFVAQLMDDEGTMNVTVTTEADYNGVKGQIKYRPEYVADNTQYRKDKLTKKLTDFFGYVADPFHYTIFEEGQKDNILYQSSPNKLFISDYFVLDEGIFDLNPETGHPLLGMGERAGSLFYKDEQGGIHSRYAFDQANPIDDGKPPGRNMYGVQPFYVYQEPHKNYFGVFNLNSYAQDFILYFNEGKGTTITNIMIGGLINKYFFRGAKPDDVIRKYQKLVGNPVATPLWSFGWQQSRFGYVTEDKWWQAFTNYTDTKFPLDTMWADIDYMDDYKIFTVSKSRYPNLAKYVDQLHAANVTFVPIMDAGVAVRQASENYTALEVGKKMDIFIKQANGKDPLTAGVWCGNAYFPDLFTENGYNYWHQMLDYLYNEEGIKFDGIWLDENEATNFCNGYCIPSERPADAKRNKPFYVPGWRDLEDKALGLDGVHGNGWTEYDLHNLFALSQTRATHDYLVNKRGFIPYVLTRSNFPGIGKYGHHWLADNWSTDEYLKYSVDGLYSYQLFGMPFIGSDICGFNTNETDIKNIAKVCTKWHILGSLYPFARNHNQNATLPHEPFQFDFEYKDKVTYLAVIKNAIEVRYNFIRYYYSAFNDIEAYGGSFFKPAFFEYPNDPKAYLEIENNIFLGNGLKASINVTSSDLKIDETYKSTFYFPKALWCQIYPPINKDDKDQEYCFESLGDDKATKTLRSNLEDYYIHIRSGSIIPYQAAQTNKVLNTKQLQDVYTDLIVLLNDDYVPLKGNAHGFIYLDDGTFLNQTVGRVEFTVSLGTDTIDITFETKQKGLRRHIKEEEIGEIKILWASRKGFDKVTYTATVTMWDGSEQKTATLDAPVYDAVTDILTVKTTYLEKGDVLTHLNFFDFGTHGFIKLEPVVTPQA